MTVLVDVLPLVLSFSYFLNKTKKTSYHNTYHTSYYNTYHKKYGTRKVEGGRRGADIS